LVILNQEQEQLAALRAKSDAQDIVNTSGTTQSSQPARRDDIEGGFGGQEDLEDRYATTSGEH
jgi:hypothetical protein